MLTGRDVSDRVALQSQLHRQANHDELTGLPNRAALLCRGEELMAGGGPLGVALMDLDRFKEINDTLGHGYGDRLLAEVGPRLAAHVRDRDLLARLGGDEFAVLMPGLVAEEARAVGERLRAALVEPFVVDGLSLEVDASIGIALQDADAVDVHALLRMADVAMYSAKELQTGVEVYDPSTDTHDRSRLTLLTEVRRAVAEHQLVLHYQPKVDLRADMGIVGVEALVRWQHPVRGLLEPAEFLPTVEHTGLIWPLTLEVLDMALRQARDWVEAGCAVPVAVNLSARCLHRADLAAVVLERLRSHDVSAGLLRLELTESALMAEPERALEHLRRLSDAGVQLSIDDFGTGYSSMSYLRRLPVDEIKVDRSFVADVSSDGGDTVLVRSMIELGHSLGMTVVAEGVEEVETLRTLEGLNCDVGQGFLFARPALAADVTALLLDGADDRYPSRRGADEAPGHRTPTR